MVLTPFLPLCCMFGMCLFDMCAVFAACLLWKIIPGTERVKRTVERMNEQGDVHCS